MGKPVAKKGDQIVGLDTHVVLVPSAGGAVPTPMPHSFSGSIERGLSTTVFVESQPIALVGSAADCLPPHIPMGGPFQRSPTNEGRVAQGSATVFVGGLAAARAGDPAKCCNDPADQETGHVIASSTVFAS